jgi:hypothetical protein
MKRMVCLLMLVFSSFFLPAGKVAAQCSICTKTAQQLGEKPAKALNTGIVYLAAMPLAIFGFIGYRWWKSNR